MKTALVPTASEGPAGLEGLGDRIAELSAHLQAATYRLLVLIGEFDQREGWHAQGARSCAHWLAWRTGLDLGAAREKVRVARALRDLPVIGAAMSRGELSYSKVRALTRVATAENEEELLRFARAGTASHVERLVRAWRRVDRVEESQVAERRRQSRYVQTYTDEDGMLVVRARLEPEAGAALLKALDMAQEQLYRSRRAETAETAETVREAETSEEASAARAGRRAVPDAVPEPEADYGQRRADALALVAESALGRGLEADSVSTGGDRCQVVVHVDAEALAEESESGHSVVEGGVGVSSETSRRLSCDASRVVMQHSRDGRTLDVGRKTRTVPPAIRRALAFRDRGCRFPGCGVRVCDAHHVEHWADGGETRLGNLVLLCKRHHRAVHEEGYRLLLRPDGSAEFFSPQGRRIAEAPGVPGVVAKPIATLAREHAERGLAIDGATATPTWRGERLDLSWTLHALRSLRAEDEGRFRGNVAVGRGGRPRRSGAFPAAAVDLPGDPGAASRSFHRV